MALTDLEAFDGLHCITTELDETEVAHLLRVNSNLGLVCQDCGGKRFKVSGLIQTEMEILSGKHTVIAGIDYKKVIVNRVEKCAYCGSEDFITIQEKDDGQE